MKIEMPNPYKKNWRKIHGGIAHVHPLMLLRNLQLSGIRSELFDFDTFAPLDFHAQFGARIPKRYVDNPEFTPFILVYNTMQQYRKKPDFEDQVFVRPYVWIDDAWDYKDCEKTPFTISELFDDPWKLIFWYTQMIGIHRSDIYSYKRKMFIGDIEEQA